MLKPFGVLLIIFSCIWFFLILAFYGDSFMSFSHAVLYSCLCLIICLAGGFLLFKSKTKKNK